MNLTRRTNVLLTESDYILLKSVSKEHGKTIGELIREAIWSKYVKRAGYNKKRLSVFKELANITAGMNFSNIDYKALIENGRRY